MAARVSVVDGERETMRWVSVVRAAGRWQPSKTTNRMNRESCSTPIGSDDPVLVELLDQRGPRHPQPARRLALVLPGRFELVRDDRALERLHPRAQRVARPRISPR